MNAMMLFVATEEKLCHTCEKPIAVGEELILELGLDDVRLIHHVKCVDLCEECIAALRAEELESREEDKTETAKLVQEMSERER